MKKTLFLLPLLSLVSAQSQAQDAETCVQVIQPAVDSNGVCKEFATPCEVPSDWKKLPASSCSDVKSEKTSARIDSVQKRRQMRWAIALKKRSAEKDTEIAEQRYKKRSNRPRIGSGQFTKDNDTIDNEANRERASLASSARRTFTTKSYDSAFIAKRKQYSVNKGGFEHTGDADKTERERRRSVRPAQQSSTDAKRTGDLQNDSKLSERRSQRFRSVGGGQSWRTQARRPKVKKEKTDLQKRLQLRRTYRGTTADRRNADVQSVTVTE